MCHRYIDIAIAGTIAANSGKARSLIIEYPRASASAGAPFAVTLLALWRGGELLQVERRVVPFPYRTRQEAVTAIECIVSTFGEAGYEPEGDFWWATTGNGEPVLDSSLKVSAVPRTNDLGLVTKASDAA